MCGYTMQPNRRENNSQGAVRPFDAVARLIELDLKIARHFEVGDQAVACIGNGVGELHATGLQFRNRLSDKAAVHP